MSFKKPYQKSGGSTVHRASRKAKYSATVGYLRKKRIPPAIEPDQMPNRSWIEFSRGLRGQNPDILREGG